MFKFSARMITFNSEKWWSKTQKEYVKTWKDDLKPYWENEEDPNNGEKWEPRKNKYPWKILKKTGEMQDQAKLVKRGNRFSARVKTYGIRHQEGISGGLPQRRWLGFSNEGLKRLAQLSCKNIWGKDARRISRKMLEIP